jgi:hypothetical protein
MRKTSRASAKTSVSSTLDPVERGPSERDRQRAEALRANLLRRKAQARDRRESDTDPDTKTGGDA